MPSLKPSIGNNEHISLDDVCFLISKTYIEDDIGQEIEVPVERQVFCSEIGVSRQEFSVAGQLGLKSKKTIVVDSDEYDQEATLMFEETRYSVYRDFRRPDGYTELYCEVRAGG